MELISQLPELNDDGQLIKIHVHVRKLPDNENTLKNDFYIYRDVIFPVEIILSIIFLSLIICLRCLKQQPGYK
jgi:hypothetical protein